ncbi:NADPH-dependent FMN reductase [Yinghuangia seranimata]|uniref:NADPH-dependent FMN reductase n=1 Tax=Yinghuangia seranimata TaxID=408067 RepID=UPI00248C80F8|nr:NAD(P)H-dependent oxidoreductase [Yinghuangia seranimata]MDI2129253.1 NAD(P)H-dependent oxidoreductase [Yinghuangia seranimata]
MPATTTPATAASVAADAAAFDASDAAEAPVKLAVVVGSTRGGRFGPTVAAWFAGHAARHGGFDVDVVDLVDTPLPAAMPGFDGPSADDAALLAEVSPRLAAADAFVVVTPEYNHSFPAALKHLIDLHFTEWQAKPVGFVAYGGMAAGLRAVEQLRQVFAELHAVTVRDTVSFHGAAGAFDGPDPRDPAGCSAAATTMLDQLQWWARALRTAKAAQPYGS